MFKPLVLSYKVQRVHWSVCAPNMNGSSNHLNCWGKYTATILSDQMHHFPGLHDKSYSNHVFCHSWFIKNICACWLSILNKFHFNLAFALSCIGNKPLQAFMVVVARYQELNPPISDYYFFHKFSAQCFTLSSQPGNYLHEQIVCMCYGKALMSWKHWQTCKLEFSDVYWNIQLK